LVKAEMQSGQEFARAPAAGAGGTKLHVCGNERSELQMCIPLRGCSIVIINIATSSAVNLNRNFRSSRAAWNNACHRRVVEGAFWMERGNEQHGLFFR
jgi:hypothetical protein